MGTSIIHHFIAHLLLTEPVKEIWKFWLVLTKKWWLTSSTTLGLSVLCFAVYRLTTEAAIIFCRFFYNYSVVWCSWFYRRNTSHISLLVGHSSDLWTRQSCVRTPEVIVKFCCAYLCPIHDADATKLSSCVASASAVRTWIQFATSSRRLPTDSVMWTQPSAVSPWPSLQFCSLCYRSRIWRNVNLQTKQTPCSLTTWNFFNNDVIMSSLVSTGNCKLDHYCRRVCSHRRRDATLQFRCVGCGVYWALCLRPVCGRMKMFLSVCASACITKHC